MSEHRVRQAIVELAQATSYIDHPREPFNPVIPLDTARDLFWRFAKRAQRRQDRTAKAARRVERSFIRAMKGGMA